MFALQFAFISLIPIGVYCPPFTSLSVLRYSFGWNNIPFGLPQTYINVFYSTLGIQSNFASNVNCMMFPLALCPIIYLILTLLGRSNSNCHTKPRLLTYGKSFLFDVPLTILLVNAPNICSSFIVSAQAFGYSNTTSLTVGIVMVSLLLAGAILFIAFRSSFK